MEEQKTIKCPGCKMTLVEMELKAHVRKCDKYPGFAIKKVRQLPRDLPILELKMIIAEIDLCREEVEDLIEYQSEKNRNSKHRSVIRNSGQYLMEELPQIDMNAFDSDIVKCKKCQRKFYASFDIASLFYVEECWHLFCKSCIMKYFDQEFVNNCGSLPCPVKACKKTIGQHQLQPLVGEKKYEAQQSKAIRRMMNIIECAKCKSQYQFISGKPQDAPAKDPNGKQLTLQDKQHYAQNRFNCPRQDCKIEQCKQCKATPYHIGLSCKKYLQRAQMKKCRYCDEPITGKNASKTNIQALKDICNSKDCQGFAQRACQKMLPCGHPCAGVQGETTCLPCLREPCCTNNQSLNGQNGEDYCNVCFIQALTASPCVRSICGHIYHEKCLQKRYQIKWLTPRVIFNFCLCPLCKKWITLPEQNPLSVTIKYNLQLYSKIQGMSLERLKFQECLKDQKLTDPKSQYYQKPNQYAMAIYAYFMCFKCKNPYFGGRKNCAEAMNQPQNQGQFKAEELVCPNCCQIPVQNCQKHGKDFIQFKCKYCCSTAQWFCWGNTHFCQPCHKKQCNGDYVSKYPKDKLPKCPGKGKCPVGGDHDGNGEQKSLGCAVCRNFKQNNKNF